MVNFSKEQSLDQFNKCRNLLPDRAIIELGCYCHATHKAQTQEIVERKTYHNIIEANGVQWG